jgi:hypothetical protein
MNASEAQEGALNIAFKIDDPRLFRMPVLSFVFV